MSLINRIATSNGNKLRKAAANLTLAALDKKKVSDWNHSLQHEISQKTGRHLGMDLPLSKTKA